MISTLGEVHDLGWRLRVYCRVGKRDGMKSIRACTAYVDMDLPSLIAGGSVIFAIEWGSDRVQHPQHGGVRRSLSSGIAFLLI
jgi:hypothetical protein